MKELIKYLFERVGFKIISLNNYHDSFLDQKKLLDTSKEIIIFDVGAHHGQTALKYNKIFKECTIYSFEPFIESFTILQDKVKAYTNIKTFNTALGNIAGTVAFNSNEFSATNSLLDTDRESSITWGDNQLNTLKTIKVNCITLDNFLEKESIHTIDILKLDTQGAEYLVIEGAQRAIEQTKIKLIYLEILIKPTYHQQKHFDEVLKMLRLHGFNLHNIYNHSLTDKGELRQVDALFSNSKWSQH